MHPIEGAHVRNGRAVTTKTKKTRTSWATISSAPTSSISTKPGADYDHDHDHFEFDDDGPLEENPIWLQDHVTLVSVGIDIGSSGTQVIFSRINLRRYGEDLTSRYYVVSRETLYQSPVALTPYASEERIDDAGLKQHHRRRLQGRRARPRQDRHRRGDPHRRGAAPRERRGHRQAPVGAGRRFRLRHRRPSHGVDACGLRLGRLEGVARRRQAHPQHRHRRRHHQARDRREGLRDRDRGRAYRRPPAGGRREGPHRAARSRRPLPRAAGRLRLAQGRRDRCRSCSTRSPRPWPTSWSRR